MHPIATPDSELPKASSSGAEMPEEQLVAALVSTSLGTGILLKAAASSSIEEVKGKKLSNALPKRAVYIST